METEHAMLFKIACGLHGNVTLFEATPQCLHKNSINVSVSRIASLRIGSIRNLHVNPIATANGAFNDNVISKKQGNE